MARGSCLNPNIDVVRFGVVDNFGPFAFYVEVAGTALQGGGPSPGTMDSVRIFVDIDGSATTGYRVDGLGADRMLDVSGYGGGGPSAPPLRGGFHPPFPGVGRGGQGGCPG